MSAHVTAALIAMGVYGVAALFLRLALRTYPSESAIVLVNAFLVGLGLVWALTRGVNVIGNVGWNVPTLYIVIAGLLISVAIIAFYTALARGPVSVVVPIFAMNFAVAAALGFLVLREPVTAARVAGVALGAVSLYLLTR
ncbi:MAG: EamA family transporter [Dehalococcoidia bacterium]|nr:EamA family transporter [Dehalococcoidia bacterium]